MSSSIVHNRQSLCHIKHNTKEAQIQLSAYIKPKKDQNSKRNFGKERKEKKNYKAQLQNQRAQTSFHRISSPAKQCVLPCNENGLPQKWSSKRNRDITIIFSTELVGKPLPTRVLKNMKKDASGFQKPASTFHRLSTDKLSLIHISEPTRPY
eukprot:TRINITY_DN2186_c0_g1_i2.p1 TRINITY_DN2186_c0_g1~~TRINITY_DN2186_c0_g1_i2.p1  ORF type:complete len:152 (+),score=17.54 TRINITY_DN2186_c0_g1_i2:265-720(+)